MTAFEQQPEQLDMSSMFELPKGFRFKRLEVYNWGTFDGNVWVLTPQMETALLTGDVGSGKSTLVDALVTLLIPPRRIRYNRAADSSAKERSVTSYVHGYYGQKRGEQGSGKHEALRGTGSYSVLLGVFCDQSLNRNISLIQFFWHHDSSKPITRFYAIGEQDMGIAADLSGFDGDIRAFKKHLRDELGLQIFDDYKHYSLEFTNKLGIRSEQALELFQQTVAMKKVDELTSFVRENMLEDPQIRGDIDTLIERFEDLNSAHDAVVRAKRQIELLSPIATDNKRRATLEKERSAYVLGRNWLPTWFANKRLELIEADLNKLQNSATKAKAKEQHAIDVLAACTRELENIREQIRENGGTALETLRAQIERLKFDLERVREKRTQYDRLCENLDISAPQSAEEFALALQNIAAVKTAAQDKYSQLDAQRQELAVELARQRTELKTLQAELESLRGRKSSIPSEQVRIRERLATELGLIASDLPFVGELLEVRENESMWEGAIERLLHSFALALLVPTRYYKQVMEWVDNKDLKARLVYFRVGDSNDKAVASPSTISVAGKLSIKPDSEFFGWLSGELVGRYSHVCATTPEQFRREPNAITAAGQIKSGGKRHEKDDRHKLINRTRYVLGFSNLRKIAALESSFATLQSEEQALTAREQLIVAEQSKAQAQRELLAQLQAISDFAEIDTATPDAELGRLTMRKIELESGNNVLAELEHTRQTLNEQRDQLESARLAASKDLQRIELNIEGQEKARLDTLAQIADVLPDDDAVQEFVPHGTFLEINAEHALGAAHITLSIATDLERKFTKWLNAKIDAHDKRLNRLTERIIREMGEFKNAYPQETNELDSTLESANEFIDRLKLLKRDDLPRFERRFKEMLNTDVINNISLFNSKLTKMQSIICDRVEAINKSLYEIDYNDGRFIRLVIDDTNDSEIRDFKAQLRACTEGALGAASNEDEHYSENKFLEVKAILERFKERPSEPERDRAWTRKVTDVRNWYLFAASERWRETDEEHEHYTDSAGKSGGQKEKLAYMILAASLVYHYGLDSDDNRAHGFRFVIIDEAFLKSSDEAARFGLELFKKLDLQLLIVTPLLKVNTIAPYIAHVGFVSHNDISHKSALINITIDEFERQRALRKAAPDANLD